MAQSQQQSQGPVRQCVFVYGTLKTGGRLNVVLDELATRKVGDARLDGWTLHEMSNGAFPGAIRADGEHHVDGEVWQLAEPDVAMKVLDAYEGAPVLSVRAVVTVTLANGRDVECVMYALTDESKLRAGPHIGSYFEADMRKQQWAVVDARRREFERRQATRAR